MGLATINSQYTGLNGLSGYGSTYFMGGGLYSDSYVENAKSNIANGYELSATSSSYSNKNSVSSSSFAQQCQAIEYLLQQGRTDDAMAKYKDLYDDMASNSYYEGYTENEIKTLLQEKYMTATGTTLVNDITTNSNSAFTSGLESSIPVLGLLFNENSSDDFVAEATGTEVSGWSNVKKGAGVVAGVGLSAAAGAGLEVGLSALKNLKNSSITEAISKAATGKGKIVAACVAGGAALLTYIGSKLFNSDNK
ncbi:TPA: hypothetical protein IAA92_01070 [Candidatus Galligastranaerophilus intestinigallinarum]|nr:hypothetical protein [Candidatus Galligastranaerophilus intestinigallinarum]